jgi:hypothetical protein
MIEVKDLTKYALLYSAVSTIFTTIAVFTNFDEIKNDPYTIILLEAFGTALIIQYVQNIFSGGIRKTKIEYFTQTILLSIGAMLTALRQTFNLLYKENISKQNMVEIVIEEKLDHLIEDKAEQLRKNNKIYDLLKSFQKGEYHKTLKEILYRYKLLQTLLNKVKENFSILPRDIAIEIGLLSSEIDKVLSHDPFTSYFDDKSTFINKTLNLVKHIKKLINTLMKTIKGKERLELFLYFI